MRPADKLVLMANQIGRFFAHQGPERAPAAIADHMRKFWDPHMRASLRAHLAAGGKGLDELAERAVERL